VRLANQTIRRLERIETELPPAQPRVDDWALVDLIGRDGAPSTTASGSKRPRPRARPSTASAKPRSSS
jgi:hypothetical protein